MHQYSGNGITNVLSPSDLNIFRGDSTAWNKIAAGTAPAQPTPTQPSQPAQPDLEDLATRTIRGDFGNGQDRINALGSNYDSVMAIVNQRLGGGGVDLNELAWATIRGDFGNGQDRLNALGANYGTVMQLVNQLLGA